MRGLAKSGRPHRRVRAERKIPAPSLKDHGRRRRIRASLHARRRAQQPSRISQGDRPPTQNALPTLYAHLLPALNQSDPLGFSQALSQCVATSDWLKQHAQFIPREPGEAVGSPPTHIPDYPTDLITSKQGYSDRKLARNHNAKNLIELRILYMCTPALYPEDEVDLRAQSAPDAGA